MPTTTGPAIPPGAAVGGDPVSSASDSASAILVPIGRHRRRALVFGGVGVAAYLLALLAGVPARIVLPADLPGVRAVSGTLWHGEAMLAGGDRLAWRFAPLRTIATLSLAADMAITGPQTDLTGRVAATRTVVRIDSVSGRAGGSLLRAAFPDLPFTCDLAMTVNLPTIAIGDATPAVRGDVRSTPGTCTPVAGGTARPVPALLATARAAGPDATAVVVTPPTQRRRVLARTVFSAGDHVSVTVPAAGALMFPFASPPGGLMLDTTL